MMQTLSYVAVVVNCCVFPLLFLYAGFIWGRFGLPISVKQDWGKKQIKGIRKRKADYFEEPEFEAEAGD
jgi:hypothetical protein